MSTYKIISASKPCQLEKKVQEYLDNGYKIQGTISVCACVVKEQFKYLYSISMIKEQL